jgi:hypothetical protein
MTTVDFPHNCDREEADTCQNGLPNQIKLVVKTQKINWEMHKPNKKLYVYSLHSGLASLKLFSCQQSQSVWF